MKKHTKANGYFKDVCHYSKTGWAWWRYPQLGDVTTNPYCTCKPCTPPNKARTRPILSGRKSPAKKSNSKITKPAVSG